MSTVNPTSIKTYRGTWFDILNPRVEDVCIEDIAHALANQVRFNGHSRVPYTVAEHSCYVSKMLSFGVWDLKTAFPSLGLEGLLHDSAEAYVGDLVNPLKRAPGLEKYIEIEDKILDAIGEKFGCVLNPMHPAVHETDRRLLATEQRDIMDGEITVPFRPYDWHIESIGLVAAEVKFLAAFEALKKKGK